MKCFLFIGLPLIVMLVGCTKHDNVFAPLSDSHKDVEYTILLDSMEAALDAPEYHNFNDTLIQPALTYYSEGHTLRHLWMQARCHYLIGNLIFDKNYHSEEAVTHFLETLALLDTHFNPEQKLVGGLYSKTYDRLSRIAFNYSDEQLSKRLAKNGLDYAKKGNDTVWIARSYPNLASYYERFGRKGEGDTAFYYCHEGLKYVSDSVYPKEYARLCRVLGDCYCHSASFDTALMFFSQAKTLFDSASPMYHHACLKEAFVYFMMQDYPSAMADLEQSFTSKDKSLRTQSAYGLTDCYEIMGDTLKASQYFSIVKVYNDQANIDTHQNTKAVPMMTAYLSAKENHRGQGLWWWIAALTVVVALFALFFTRIFHNKLQKKEQEALQLREESQRLRLDKKRMAHEVNENLLRRVKKIYADLPDDAYQRILTEFNATYPHTYHNLQSTFPDLTEPEVNLCILSFLSFRVKEISRLTGYSENTISKYRTNIRRKTNFDDLKALISRFLE